MQLLHYNIPLREKEGTNRPLADFYIFHGAQLREKSSLPVRQKAFSG